EEHRGSDRGRGRPSWAARHRRIGDREERGRRGAGDRPGRRGRREARALLEGEEERDRTGREGQPDEPAAYRWTPAPAGQRGDRNERRCENDLEGEDGHASAARVSRSISAMRRLASVMHVSSALAIASRWRGSRSGGSSSSSSTSIAPDGRRSTSTTRSVYAIAPVAM